MKSHSKKKPFVSIIILNYNGQRVLSATLDSVLVSSYPHNSFEIIVVDNKSTDKSKSVLKKYAKNPQIKLIFSQKNGGFTGGNNLGFEEARGEYIILLNNDCIVEKTWIHDLVERAESDPNIFAVNSKILLYPRFFPLTIQTDLGYMDMEVLLQTSALSTFKNSKKLISAHHSFDDNQLFTIHIPTHPTAEDQYIKIEAHVYTPQRSKPQEHFFVTPQPWISSITFETNHDSVIISITVDVKKIPQNIYFDKVQNAGIVMFDNGSGRDIGAVVRYYTQDYERDLGQYNEPREVYAACGAAVLYRKSILDQIGLFSEDFFMYYEDVDVAERARLKGYSIWYEPQAIVRHMHALSSEEWSPFFIYHAEKGRLVHIFHHFPLWVCVQEYFFFSLAACIRIIVNIGKSSYVKDIQYIRVVASIFLNIPKYLAYRTKWTPTEKSQQLYNDLRSGKWILP